MQVFAVTAPPPQCEAAFDIELDGLEPILQFRVRFVRDRLGEPQSCMPLISEALPPAGSSETPSSSIIDFKKSVTRATVEDGRSGPNPSYGTCSGWWVILPWRLGAVHHFTGTQAARNSGPRHEKAADAGVGLLLWGSDTCM